jgi:hypothetical protein
MELDGERESVPRAPGEPFEAQHAALIAAILSGHFDTLIEVADRQADAADPGAALLEFLTVAADERRRHDVDFFCPISEEDSGVVELRGRLFAGIEVLVERARQAGANPLPRPAPSLP